MSALFVLPRQFVIDGAGDPRPGALLNFYAAGTLTRQDTYSDSDLTTPNTNPVVADSSGVFGPIYLARASYRVILEDSDSVQIWDQDDVNIQNVGFGESVLVKSGNYTVTGQDRGVFLEFTAAATCTLPAMATAGEGFVLAVSNTGTGEVTIDPGAATINGAGSLTLYPQGFALITSDGTSWRAIFRDGIEQSSFTGTLTGYASNPTPTVAYVRDGLSVSLYINSGASGTSNADALTMTGIPAHLRPSTSVIELTRVTDDGTTQLGVASISSTGTITFGLFGEVGATYSSAAFTNSGTKGLPGGWSLRYTLN